ncbi:hypothetical protein ACGFSI_35395 [Streptomyces virginiae]
MHGCSRVPPHVKVGDKVIYGPNAGTQVTIAGQSYLQMIEEDLTVLPG